MDLKERLEKVDCLMDWSHIPEDVRRLARLEVKVDWLIEKLIDEPEKAKQTAEEIFQRLREGPNQIIGHCSDHGAGT